MDIKSCLLRVWDVNVPASDGSIISREVFQDYINSPQYRESIEAGNALGSMTHISRDNKHMAHKIGDVSKLIGKDDQMLLANEPLAAPPVWRIKRLYLDGSWLMAEMDILNEDGTDELMHNSITRLKSLLSQGVLLGVSAVIVAFWDGGKGGADICQKIHAIKSIDITQNPSQKKARIVDIMDSEGDSILDDVKTFSDREESQMKSGTPVTKTFSDISSIPGISELPRTSKIGLKFTTLKVKQFSCFGEVKSVNGGQTIKQKSYSVAAVKERVRYAKLSPRMQFRRLIIDYKGALRAGGNNLSEEDKKIMKSLLASDILQIIKQIHPEIMQGKQIATLIGASSISKNARVASQKLQLPYKMAMQQVQKSGQITQDRWKKIQQAYLEFTDSIVNEVFNGTTQISENSSDDDED